MRLCPCVVPSHSVWSEGEGCEVVGDVHEQSVGGFWEVVAHGNTLIIGTYDDVEEILLSLVVTIVAIVMAAPFHKVDCHLVVVIAYLCIFAISRFPCAVLASARHVYHLHSLGPHTVGVDGNAHCRLHQVVVDVDTQFALLYNSLVAIGESVGELSLLLCKDKAELAVGRQ